MKRLLSTCFLSALTLTAGVFTVSTPTCQAQEDTFPTSMGLGSRIVDGLYSRIQLYAGGELRVVKRIRLGKVPRALAFSPDDQMLAVENPQGIQFHALSGVLMGSIEVAVVSQSPFYSSSPTLAFTTDQSRLLLVRDGVLYVWKLTTKPSVLTATLEWKRENVSAAAFSPDGKQILLCEKKEAGFFLSLLGIEKGATAGNTAVWTREMGPTPAIDIAFVTEGVTAGKAAHVLTCSVPNRFYAPDSTYERALRDPVTASITTWSLENGETKSSFGLADYFPGMALFSPRGTFVLYQSVEGANVVNAATGIPMRSGLHVQSHVAISGDEALFSSQWSLARFTSSSRAIVEYPNNLVFDSSRHMMVAPSALSSDGTYWAVTAAAVPFAGRRSLSAPVVLVWELAV